MVLKIKENQLLEQLAGVDSLHERKN